MQWLFLLKICLLALLGYLVYWLLWQYYVFKENVAIGKQSGRVLTHKYTCFRLGLLVQNLLRDQEQRGDAMASMIHNYTDYDIMISAFFGRSYLVFFSPQLIKQFYNRVQQGCYIKNMGIGYQASISPCIKDGLVFAEEQLWSGHRKIFVQVFNYAFIQSKIPKIVQILERQITNELNKISFNTTLNPFNVKSVFRNIFGNIVIKCFFGNIQLPQIQGKNIFMYVNELFSMLGARGFSPITLLGKRFFQFGLRSVDRDIKKRYNAIRVYSANIIHKFINEKKQQQAKTENKFEGIMELLVRKGKLIQRRILGQNYDFYTYEQFTDEMLTFFFAGTDTTATMITSLIGEVMKHKEVQLKLRQQIISVTKGTNQSLCNPQILKKLQYLTCVQKQTLRTRPPAPGIFTRIALKRHRVGPYQIYPDMFVNVWLMPNHYNPAYFENPIAFKPQRWFDTNNNKSQLSYLPFSFGQRNCIGQQFALLQSKIAVAVLFNLLPQFKLSNPNYRYIFSVVYQPEQVLLQNAALQK